MASLRDIRKRIRSVKNTRQITKAMKMVSAAKLRRAQDNVIAARPYAQTLDAVMSTLISRSEPGSLSHPLLTRREVKKVELLVVTSDRGLAGGFNANINRRALKYIAEQQKAGIEVLDHHRRPQGQRLPPRPRHSHPQGQPGPAGRSCRYAAGRVAGARS